MTTVNASSFADAVSSGGLSFLARLAGRWINVPVSLVRTIESRLMIVTSNVTLTAADASKVVSNVGASAAVTVTLPAAVLGTGFLIVVREAQNLSLLAAGTDRLESTAVPPVLASVGQQLRSNTIGSMLRLECLTAGRWAVVDSRGTWAVV